VTDTTKQDGGTQATVTVIGGGLAGLAASIHLAKRNFRVTCIEPVAEFNRMVGESLDWSAPDLLAELGLPMEKLIQSEICTFKRHVILQMPDGSKIEYVPSDWLGRPPLNIELRTLHVDRLRLHQELSRIAGSYGVLVLRDRVVGLDKQGERIVAVRTELGRTIASEWFVDASGSSARVIGRALQLPEIVYGPKKVAFWSHLTTSDWQEGTTLYAHAPERGYMNWVWEIPITPGTLSIGYVSNAEDFKKSRGENQSVEETYKQHLMKFDRFAKLLGTTGRDAAKFHATSFQCRTYRRVCGRNWIIVGEAASLPDPITSNGVTAALRHAVEGAKLICRSRKKRQISFWSRWLYNMRVRQMGKFFNSLIEKLAYDWPIRDRFGLLTAGDVYTIPAWSMNQIYSRLQPDGTLSTVLFCGFLAFLRGVAWCAHKICKIFPSSQQTLEVYATCT